ncbi:hypothetical protein Pcinc_021067 [Petrolisthes cinctipes]|uniref:C-type lectin domain-containing protein n=1 Tax=Petrolisthes cinctipes TaxID=88211 RepID=A0AAE1KI48_PETCI|nr:hypothetical protein Pcinc_021067 [Petrolisthes cinctipes]
MAVCIGGGAVCVGVLVMAVWVVQLRAVWSPVYFTKGTRRDYPLVAPGKMINSTQASLILNHTSRCECRAACWTAPWCVAVAAVVVSGKVQCHLSEEGPLQQDLKDNADATYYYWKRAVPHLYYGVKMRDGLLYVILEEPVTFMEAREMCQKLPGHRLAITKFKQQYNILFNTANHYDEELWVDLHSMGKDHPRIWGDKTPFDDTETRDVAETKDGFKEEKGYRMRGNELHDTDINKKYLPFCQASPSGVPFSETPWA